MTKIIEYIEQNAFLILLKLICIMRSMYQGIGKLLYSDNYVLSVYWGFRTLSSVKNSFQVKLLEKS